MTARDVLWDVAVDQYGYVTAREATDLGLTAVTVQMLVHRGGLEKVAHGVYRFPELPVTEYDSYMLAVLWTGVPEACLSHETALALYDVCDINPTKVHMTVPRDRRVRRSGGDQYVLHHEDLAAAEIGWLHQIRATKPETTLRQCIRDGVPSYLLRQALENAAGRGLLLADQVTKLEEQLGARDS